MIINVPLLLSGLGLTNNSCEGFNSSWTRGLPCNPSLWVVLNHMVVRDGFVEQMLREEALAVGGMQHHNRGRTDDKTKKKLDLQKLCEKFPSMDRKVYIRAAMGHID